LAITGLTSLFSTGQAERLRGLSFAFSPLCSFLLPSAAFSTPALF
jgi:hypothetical protein